jgi:chromosome segregation ATPase
MQEQTNQPKNRLLGLGVIAVAAIISAVGITKFVFKGNKEAAPINSNYRHQYDSAQMEIAFLKLAADQKNDTLQRLKMEVGQMGIQLNRSEAKINDLTRRILKAPTGPQKVGEQILWTGEIAGKMLDCDSLAYELHFVYLDKARDRQLLADSLNAFYEEILNNKDSTIEAYARVDTMSFTELARVQAERDKAVKQRDQAKRKQGIGWIAAAVMGAIALLSNIAN